MPEFKVLKGGLSNEPDYNFIDAFVTDTRLMGVLGLRVHWFMTSPYQEEEKHIYHFYYYDLEELGLDSLKIFELADEEAVALATKSCFGGLGANMMRVSEKEARYLINYFIDDTIKKGEELPISLSLAGFVREEKPVLSDAELSGLNYKMCTGIRTNYGVVNYYLMRSLGRDFEGAGFLLSDAAKPEDLDLIALSGPATFLQNTIEEFVNMDGSMSYLCESVVQAEDGYHMVTSELKVSGGKVYFAKKKGEFKISIEEASMILNRGEYVTVYKILADMEDFDVDFAPFSIGTTRTEHEAGDMYMDFNPNNDHVEEKVFKLNADLYAIYYVTDEGELVVGTYSIDDMTSVEEKILDSIVGVDTIMLARMQFPTEIVYEFAQSGFGSFGEFIQTLHNE